MTNIERVLVDHVARKDAETASTLVHADDADVGQDATGDRQIGRPAGVLALQSDDPSVEGEGTTDIDRSLVDHVARDSTAAAGALVHTDHAGVSQDAAGDGQVGGPTGILALQTDDARVAEATGSRDCGVANAAVAPHPDSLLRADVPP